MFPKKYMQKKLKERLKKELEDFMVVEIKIPANFSILATKEQEVSSVDITNRLESIIGESPLSISDKNIEQVLEKITTTKYEHPDVVYGALRNMTESPLFSDFMAHKEGEGFVQNLINKVKGLASKQEAELIDVSNSDKFLIDRFREQVETSRRRNQEIIDQVDKIQAELNQVELELQAGDKVKGKIEVLRHMLNEKVPALLEDLSKYPTLKEGYTKTMNILASWATQQDGLGKVDSNSTSNPVGDALNTEINSTPEVQSNTTERDGQNTRKKIVSKPNDNVYNLELNELMKNRETLSEKHLEIEARITQLNNDIQELNTQLLDKTEDEKVKFNSEIDEKKLTVAAAKEEIIIVAQERESNEQKINDLQTSLKAASQDEQPKPDTIDSANSPLRNNNEPAHNGPIPVFSSNSPSKVFTSGTVEHHIMFYLDRLQKYLKQLDFEIQSPAQNTLGASSSQAITQLLCEASKTLTEIIDRRSFFTESDREILQQLPSSTNGLSPVHDVRPYFNNRVSTESERDDISVFAVDSPFPNTSNNIGGFNRINAIKVENPQIQVSLTIPAKLSEQGEQSNSDGALKDKDSLMKIKQSQNQTGQITHEIKDEETTLRLREEKNMEHISIQIEKLEEVGSDLLSILKRIGQEKLDISKLERAEQLMVEVKQAINGIIGIDKLANVVDQDIDAIHKAETVINHPVIAISPDHTAEAGTAPLTESAQNINAVVDNQGQAVPGEKHISTPENVHQQEQLARKAEDLEKLQHDVNAQKQTIAKTLTEMSKDIQATEDQKMKLDQLAELIKQLGTKHNLTDSATPTDTAPGQLIKEDMTKDIESAIKELTVLLASFNSSAPNTSRAELLEKIKTATTSALDTPGDTAISTQVVEILRIVQAYLVKVKQSGQNIDLSGISLEGVNPSAKDPDHQHEKFLSSLQLYLGTLVEKSVSLDPKLSHSLSQMRYLIDQKINPESVQNPLSQSEASSNPPKEENTNEIIAPEDVEGQNSQKGTNQFLQSLEMYLGSLAQSSDSLPPQILNGLNSMRLAIDKRVNPDSRLFISEQSAESPLAKKYKNHKLSPEEIEGIVNSPVSSPAAIHTNQFLKKLELLLGSLSEQGLPKPASKCLSDIRRVVYQQIEKRENVKPIGFSLNPEVVQASQEAKNEIARIDNPAPGIPHTVLGDTSMVKSEGNKVKLEEQVVLVEDLKEMLGLVQESSLLKEITVLVNQRLTEVESTSDLPAKPTASAGESQPLKDKIDNQKSNEKIDAVVKTIENVKISELDEETRKALLDSVLKFILQIQPDFTYGSEKSGQALETNQDKPRIDSGVTHTEKEETPATDNKTEAVKQAKVDESPITVADIMAQLRERVGRLDQASKEKNEIASNLRIYLGELQPTIILQQNQTTGLEMKGSEKSGQALETNQDKSSQSTIEPTPQKREEASAPQVQHKSVEEIKAEVTTLISSISDTSVRSQLVTSLIPTQSPAQVVVPAKLSEEAEKTHGDEPKIQVSLAGFEESPEILIKNLERYINSQENLKENSKYSQDLNRLHNLLNRVFSEGLIPGDSIQKSDTQADEDQTLVPKSKTLRKASSFRVNADKEKVRKLLEELNGLESSDVIEKFIKDAQKWFSDTRKKQGEVVSHGNELPLDNNTTVKEPVPKTEEPHPPVDIKVEGTKTSLSEGITNTTQANTSVPQNNSAPDITKLSEAVEKKTPFDTNPDSHPIDLDKVKAFILDVQKPTSPQDITVLKEISSHLIKIVGRDHIEPNGQVQDSTTMDDKKQPISREEIVKILKNLDPASEEERVQIAEFMDVLHLKMPVVQQEHHAKQHSQDATITAGRQSITLEEVKSFILGYEYKNTNEEETALAEIAKKLERMVPRQSVEVPDVTKSSPSAQPEAVKSTSTDLKTGNIVERSLPQQSTDTVTEKSIIPDASERRSEVTKVIASKEVSETLTVKEATQFLVNLKQEDIDANKDILRGVVDKLLPVFPKPVEPAANLRDTTQTSNQDSFSLKKSLLSIDESTDQGQSFLSEIFAILKDKLPEQAPAITLEDIKVFLTNFTPQASQNEDIRFIYNRIGALLPKDSNADKKPDQMKGQIGDISENINLSEVDGSRKQDEIQQSQNLDIHSTVTNIHLGQSQTPSGIPLPSSAKLILPQLLSEIDCSDSEDFLRNIEDAVLKRLNSIKPNNMKHTVDITSIQTSINSIEELNVLFTVLNTVEKRINGINDASLNQNWALVALTSVEKVTNPADLQKLFDTINSKLHSAGVIPAPNSSLPPSFASNQEETARMIANKDSIKQPINNIEGDKATVKSTTSLVTQPVSSLPATTPPMDLEKAVQVERDNDLLRRILKTLKEKFDDTKSNIPQKPDITLVKNFVTTQKNLDTLKEAAKLFNEKILLLEKPTSPAVTVTIEDVRSAILARKDQPDQKDQFVAQLNTMLQEFKLLSAANPNQSKSSTGMDSTQPAKESSTPRRETSEQNKDGGAVSKQTNTIVNSSEEGAFEEADKAIDRIANIELLRRLLTKLSELLGQQEKSLESLNITRELSPEQLVERIDDRNILTHLLELVKEKLGATDVKFNPSLPARISVPGDFLDTDLEEVVLKINNNEIARKLSRLIEEKFISEEPKLSAEITAQDVQSFIWSEPDADTIRSLLKVAEERVQFIQNKPFVRPVTIEDITNLIGETRSKQDKMKIATQIQEIVKSYLPPPKPAASPVQQREVTADQLLESIQSMTDQRTLGQIMKIIEVKLPLVNKSTHETRLVIELKDVVNYFKMLSLPTGSSRQELQKDLIELLSKVLHNETRYPGGNTTVEAILVFIQEKFGNQALNAPLKDLAIQAKKVEEAIKQSKTSTALIEFANERLKLAKIAVGGIGVESVLPDGYLKQEDIQVNLDMEALSALVDGLLSISSSFKKNFDKSVDENAKSMGALKTYLKTSNGKIDSKMLGELLCSVISSEGKLIGMRSVELHSISKCCFIQIAYSCYFRTLRSIDGGLSSHALI